MGELTALDREWWSYVAETDTAFQMRCKHATWLTDFVHRGTDALALMAQGAWLVDGPKVFVPTPEQCAALEQVEVNVHLSDYQQPYPALFVAALATLAILQYELSGA